MERGYNIIGITPTPKDVQECDTCIGSILEKFSNVYKCRRCGAVYTEKELKMDVGLKVKHSNKNSLKLITGKQNKRLTDQQGNPIPEDDQVAIDDLAHGFVIKEYKSTEFD